MTTALDYANARAERWKQRTDAARARYEALVNSLLDLADEMDEIDGDAWVSLGGVSLGGAIRHAIKEAGE